MSFVCHSNARIPLPTETPSMGNVSAVSSSSSGCVKCGTTKRSGKRSCCAPGGAWFKNCGNAGDTKFDHTWVEGIEACKDFVTSGSVSIQSLLQAMPPHDGSTDQTRNSTQHRTNVDDFGDMSNSGDRHAEICVGMVKVDDHICVLFISIMSYFLT